jgi:hypothetical protein
MGLAHFAPFKFAALNLIFSNLEANLTARTSG